jgi:hypothetical protein
MEPSTALAFTNPTDGVDVSLLHKHFVGNVASRAYGYSIYLATSDPT